MFSTLAASRNLVLAFSVQLLTAVPQGALGSPSCAEGQYRNDTVVWPCKQTNDQVYLLRDEFATPVVHIPKGVENLNWRVQAPSDGDFSILLHDQANSIITVGGTGESQSRIYQGMTISCEFLIAGDAACHIDRTRIPLDLELSRESRETFFFVFNFSYTGLESPCPSVPSGCGVNEEGQAQEDVVAWSRWAQCKSGTYQKDKEEVWQELTSTYHVESPDKVIPWFMWLGVWVQWQSAALNRGSQAFHYLDTNLNEEISKTEFLAGLALVDACSPDSPQTKKGSDSGLGVWILGILVALFLLVCLLCCCCWLFRGHDYTPVAEAPGAGGGGRQDGLVQVEEMTKEPADGSRRSSGRDREEEPLPREVETEEVEAPPTKNIDHDPLPVKEHRLEVEPSPEVVVNPPVDVSWSQHEMSLAGREEQKESEEREREEEEEEEEEEHLQEPPATQQLSSAGPLDRLLSSPHLRAKIEAHPASLCFHQMRVLGYRDPLTDGFRACFQREVLLVDSQADPALRGFTAFLSSSLPERSEERGSGGPASTFGSAVHIAAAAKAVAAGFGGSGQPGLLEARWQQRLHQLRLEFPQDLPVGLLLGRHDPAAGLHAQGAGLQRHRAVLFKYICDQCRVCNSALLWDQRRDSAVNLAWAGGSGGRPMLVDVGASQPGQLREAFDLHHVVLQLMESKGQGQDAR